MELRASSTIKSKLCTRKITPLFLQMLSRGTVTTLACSSWHRAALYRWSPPACNACRATPVQRRPQNKTYLRSGFLLLTRVPEVRNMCLCWSLCWAKKKRPNVSLNSYPPMPTRCTVIRTGLAIPDTIDSSISWASLACLDNMIWTLQQEQWLTPVCLLTVQQPVVLQLL